MGVFFMGIVSGMGSGEWGGRYRGENVIHRKRGITTCILKLLDTTCYIEDIKNL
jgi:hypothetical protein